MNPVRNLLLSLLLLPLPLTAQLPNQNPAQPPLAPAADGLRLPAGFKAEVVHPGVGPARHLSVRANGDIYVRLSKETEGGGIAALRDTNGDGTYDQVEYFGPGTGTGIALATVPTTAGDIEYLYYSTATEVLRQEFAGRELVPAGPVETVVEGFPRQHAHNAKSIALDGEGRLFVNSGAPSNACQEQPRTPGSKGIVNCPQLEQGGGIWVFDAATTDQRQTDGKRFATGLRNCVALAWNPAANQLYTVMHGRDQLDFLFPKLFSQEDNARLPAEEMHLLKEGSNAGWPYTYWDPFANRRMLAPEYGGQPDTAWKPGLIRGLDGGDDFQAPVIALPAHWAPNALVFYTSSQFPERYQGGAFIAFHGSWNRAPLPQGGYNVVFVPFDGEQASGGWENFADGFAGEPEVISPGSARARPCGLAVGPDGSLYISDSRQGRLWRISYED
ncbi:PQQ-dependent sugar dehydrogenase [Ruficoccus amylovorans]|uniref:PQQ-dependent sugar dehydrogenase n=1 Tax=Ruficoccus amylovorans TaxID=1804625 RepID=A0A842HFB7_9BACT|nr:PQQ-dependent sugar dehydrogenase [Ruficoccus amylovorans]MBC2594959.1 PQQ-dependent sugar dehydrogenase [Ruficoccus amylovorans]